MRPAVNYVVQLPINLYCIVSLFLMDVVYIFVAVHVVCRFAYVRYVLRLSPRSEWSADMDAVLVSTCAERSSSFCCKYFDFFNAPVVIFSYSVVGFILFI